MSLSAAQIDDLIKPYYLMMTGTNAVTADGAQTRLGQGDRQAGR